MEEAKKALTSDDVEELKKATEVLTAASHKVAETLYKQSSGAAAAEAQGAANEAGAEGGGVEDAEVVDAEVVEEVKDEEKKGEDKDKEDPVGA